MRWVIVWVAWVGITMSSACVPSPARVPVFGETNDVGQLAGEWTGEFSSVETGRGGTIAFSMNANPDSAFGGVLMTLWGDSNRRAGATATESRHPVQTIESLTITFVKAEGDQVSGRLDPYMDPECGCMLFTTFIGKVQGDVIEGTYTTRRDSGQGPIVTGHWSVTRKH